MNKLEEGSTEVETLRKKYIGDKDFYKMVLVLVIPMMIQKGITNFVSLLDNVMVGKLGTEQIAGVAIANQLVFVFNLCVFGAISGVGIFTAQYYGTRDIDGVRSTLQLKIIITTILTVIALVIFGTHGGSLIRLYLLGDTTCGDLEAAYQYGKEYLFVIIIGFLPFSLSQCYSSTLRECGETVMPMIASVVAVVTNLGLNCLLIFGLCGAPQLGAKGAAIATVVSRFVELFVTFLWIAWHQKKLPFMQGVISNIHISRKLVGKVMLKGTPLMLNETIWAAAQACINQFYSTRGMEVVTAINITSTISNLFFVVYFSLGESIAIIVGQYLGMDDMEKARDVDRKLIFFSVVSCFAIGVLLVLLAPVFPRFYQTEKEVKQIAKSLIMVAGIFMPVYAFEHATYFTIRSGGRTFITFLFDSIFACCVNMPVIYVMCHNTDMPIVPLYAVCQTIEFIKCTVGGILVKKGVWLRNIVNQP